MHLLIPLLLTLPAHAGKKDKAAKATPAAPPMSMSISPPANIFLRSSFDTDPSRYLGRFLPDGATSLDESQSTKTQCSTLVTWAKVGGGGAVRDELFQVSTEAAASIGLPPLAAADGRAVSSQMVRVRYTETGKLVSDIEDPAAFKTCCLEADDQCTDRYVGEFLEGRAGQIYYAVGNESEFNASGIGGGVAGEVEVKHGLVWRKGVEFENPVYFGFKSSLTGVGSGPEAGCGEWTQKAPRSSEGMYFVGVSEYLDSERMAREAAMIDARVQVVKWLGESITTGSGEVRGYGGDVNALSVKLKNESFLETAAGGVASLVKDENWCVEGAATPAGHRSRVKVLAFIPKVSYTAAAEVLED